MWDDDDKGRWQENNSNDDVDGVNTNIESAAVVTAVQVQDNVDHGQRK